MTYLRQLPKKTLILPIGLPASGKSTFYRALKDVFKDAVLDVSFDNALEALAKKNGVSYGQAFELTRTSKEAKDFVDEHYKMQMERAMFHQGIVFIDQTNLTDRGRSNMMSKFKSFYKVGVEFKISAEESKRRCQDRFIRTGKKIPSHVIDSMAKSAANNRPNPLDFDMFVKIDTSKKLARQESIDNLVKSAQVNKRLPRP
jgi:predicted kinase